ncbi:hypothetical protein [Marinicauda salina]|uniref:hypothetical protein n=1 Tax=Marinicauda salina TaxID=2135793 RepID=UPI001304B6BE|nr:hypothetical protein [Marinicauda salina]
MRATELAFSPLVADWLIWTLIAIHVAALAFAAARGLRGWIWRGLAAGVLLIALANPALVREERDPLADIALMVVDDSASMAVGGRAAAAEAAAERVRAFAGREPGLELVELAGGRAPDGTRLVETIRTGLAEIPRDRLAGVIAISDGVVHDLPDAVDALGLDAPLHHFVAGDADAGDRRLVVEQAPRYGLVGDPVNFTLRVEDESVPAGSATVYLSVDGGEPVTARVAIGRDVNVEALVQNRGANVVEIEVEAGPNELSLINNRAAVNVTGVRDRLRVLLVTGEPHNGARAWRDLLKSDPSVDLVHFTILRPLDKDNSVPADELSLIAFPTFELFQQRLNEFDLVIFDRYRRRGILPPLYINNIAQYVEGGGALLVTTGPPFAGAESIARSPLAAVLPTRPTGTIIEQPFSPAISEAGARHPVTAPLADDQADWGPWFRQIGGTAIAGETLLEGPDGAPLLVLSRENEGRAAILMSDQSWLWARGYEGGGPHDELFRRVAHWLMGEPELDEERLAATVSDGVLEATRTTLAEDAPPLEITPPGGETETLEMTEAAPGRFTASTGIDAIGLVRLRSGDLTTVVSSGPLNPREYAELVPDPEGLAPLVEASGGGVFEIGAGADPVTPNLRRTRAGNVQRGFDWAGLQRNEAYVVADAERTPLAPGLLMVILALGLLGWAWRREGE